MDDARLAAGRYAEALSQAVSDDAELEKILRDLRGLADLDARSEELHRCLVSPVISSGDKIKVLREISSRLGFDARLERTLLAMANNGRLGLLQGVCDALAVRLDRRRGVHEVRLRSAKPLGEAEKKQIEQSLRKLVDGEIRISEEVDESLLGGIVANVGAVVFDGSLKTKLSRLRSRITGRVEGRAAV